MDKHILRELKNNLTPRQRTAWQMRYQYRWRIERIAIEMGIKRSSVCELLQRAQVRIGVKRPIRISILVHQTPARPHAATFDGL